MRQQSLVYIVGGASVLERSPPFFQPSGSCLGARADLCLRSARARRSPPSARKSLSKNIPIISPGERPSHCFKVPSTS